jgi:hypothetical protein
VKPSKVEWLVTWLTGFLQRREDAEVVIRLSIRCGGIRNMRVGREEVIAQGATRPRANPVPEAFVSPGGENDDTGRVQHLD